MGDKERRIQKRVSAEVKIDYRTVGSFITDYAANISNGGVFVATSLPMSVDQKVRLRITLPGHDLPFALEGVVRWSRPAVEGEVNPGMGIEFVDFDDVLKNELEQFVGGLPEIDD